MTPRELLNERLIKALENTKKADAIKTITSFFGVQMLQHVVSRTEMKL